MKADSIPDNGDNHIDDALLLFAADGSVTAKQAARVTRHLDVCQECQARFAEAEGALRDLVLARRQSLDAQLPSAEISRAKFLSGLSRATLRERKSLGRRILASFAILRPAYLTSGVAILTLIAFSTFTVFAPLVSAQELLTRASFAEAARSSYERRVRIRLSGQEFQRTFVRGGWDSSSGAGEAGAKAIFAAAHFDWADPLSAARFAAWRESLHNRRDAVRRSHGQLTLRTVPIDPGPVQEASLTVVQATWLPVSETVVLRDGRSIDVTEMETSPEAPAVSIGPKPVSVETPSLAAETSPEKIGSGLLAGSVLVDAEVMARVALHRAGADNGSQVEFQADSGHSLVVRTTVESEEKRSDLLAALRTIAHVRPEILLVGEARATRSSALPPVETGELVLSTATPALQEELESRFPKKDERAEFVNGVLIASQSASTAAWELRRLIERYSKPEVARLGPEAQDALEDLFRTHLDGLDAAVQDAVIRIKPLSLPAAPADTPGITPGERGWRDLMASLSDGAIGLHIDLTEALSHSSGKRSADAIRESVVNRLRFLQAGLASRHREIDAHFLRESAP